MAKGIFTYIDCHNRLRIHLGLESTGTHVAGRERGPSLTGSLEDQFKGMQLTTNGGGTQAALPFQNDKKKTKGGLAHK